MAGSDGAYALEEEYSKQLIEHRGFREGPIMEYSKDLLMHEWQRTHELRKLSTQRIGGEHSLYERTTGGFENRPIGVVGAKKIASDPTQSELYLDAARLLEAFRQKKKSVREVFDLEKLTAFLAIKVLFLSSEFDPNDTKFYFNPITSRLEPIGYELNAQVLGQNERIGTWWINDNADDPYASTEFLDLFFSDPEFWSAYLRDLERVASKEYLDRLLGDLGAPLEQQLRILYTSFPHLILRTEVIYENQAHIRETLNPVKAFHAYPRTDKSVATS